MINQTYLYAPCWQFWCKKMDLTTLFKAYIKSIKIQNKSFTVIEKNKAARDDLTAILMVKCREIRQQITQLRNFLVENRASYMHFACHLKRSLQVNNNIIELTNY